MEKLSRIFGRKSSDKYDSGYGYSSKYGNNVAVAAAAVAPGEGVYVPAYGNQQGGYNQHSGYSMHSNGYQHANQHAHQQAYPQAHYQHGGQYGQRRAHQGQHDYQSAYRPASYYGAPAGSGAAAAASASVAASNQVNHHATNPHVRHNAGLHSEHSAGLHSGYNAGHHQSEHSAGGFHSGYNAGHGQYEGRHQIAPRGQFVRPSLNFVRRPPVVNSAATASAAAAGNGGAAASGSVSSSGYGSGAAAGASASVGGQAAVNGMAQTDTSTHEVYNQEYNEHEHHPETEHVYSASSGTLAGNGNGYEKSAYKRITENVESQEDGREDENHYYKAQSYGVNEDENEHEAYNADDEDVLQTQQVYRKKKNSVNYVKDYNKKKQESGSGVLAKDKHSSSYNKSDKRFKEHVDQSNEKKIGGKSESESFSSAHDTHDEDEELFDSDYVGDHVGANHVPKAPVAHHRGPYKKGGAGATASVTDNGVATSAAAGNRPAATSAVNGNSAASSAAGGAH